jgi:hypothetical protein
MAQTIWQLPPEQFGVQGEDPHDTLQLPPEQLQFPPLHATSWRVPPLPGSAIGGPPLGVGDAGPPELPPQANIAAVARTTQGKTSRFIKHLPL